MPGVNGLDIFISHSSRDAELAKALVELFRGALTLPAKGIRCTSVSGYKLPAGADTNEQLRRETVSAKVLVGLITEVSIESAYVLFELGARWGAKKYLASLLGAGRGSEILAGPLSGINALTCSREDLFQLVNEIAAELQLTAESPEVYSHLVDRVVEVSSNLASQRGLEPAEAARPASTKEMTVSLTDFQCDYLMTMSRPRNEGFIYGGIDEEKGREAAPYQEAMERFQALTLVTYGSGGYRLTPAGWKLADQLWELKILDVLLDSKFKTHKEIAKEVELTDGEPELKEVQRHLDNLEGRGLVKATAMRGERSAMITQDGVTHRKHRPLSIG